ncbi:hypothetical protein ASD15_00790 [Massilia sp. Root351]|uniref:hypothetical protein n=1 Tax=Massilia sp. Root351 TaxID=1736522 RepID=UPI00070908FF|nr:hypothetical protein [Massilia sp. Root351]KQV90656.1 hypothetical protein ASD15_00790 [Massilia sp. Root351]
MSIIDDCVKFLEDLIMGDFNDEQMVSAQIIGGLVSLIPVMDQVMDVRDISGTLYRINKHGGFGKASLDQKVDLGFAAFGVIPEVGSAFKTVFKPLYRQRKRAKGVINSGVAMIETMLGKKKGGAVRWVRALDWAGNTQAAIIQANMALESCIAMLDYLGQKHWWCPDRIEQLARDVAPSLRSMRGKLAAPIREAAAEIRKFLEGLLGEHAAAVAMSVAGNAAMVRGSGAPASRANGARSPPRHKDMAETPRTQGKKASGRTLTVAQKMAYEAYAVLNHALKGLLGEHIVDHYVIEKKSWGMQWNRHDIIAASRGGKKSGWQNDYKKINDNEIPLYLCTPSSHVLTSGIDSLWITNRNVPRQYAVVEAKASMNPGAQLLSLLGEANGTAVPGQSPGGQRPGSGGNRTGAARPRPARKPVQSKVLQMSEEWVQARLRRDFGSIFIRVDDNYTRHVMLVTPVEAAEHISALNKILENDLINKPREAQEFASEHANHSIANEFDAVDIDKANETYKKSGKPPKTRPKK